MQRRNFLKSSGAGVTALAIGQTAMALPARTEQGYVVKAAESRFDEKTIISGSSPIDIKDSSKDTDGILSISEFTGNGKGGPPLHVHPHQDEVFYILDGEDLFQMGEEKYSLKAGDTIFLPRNIPHAFAQLTEKGKMLFFFQPAGKMEDFFRTIGKLPTDLTPEQGARIFADHEMKVVGPPLQY